MRQEAKGGIGKRIIKGNESFIAHKLGGHHLVKKLDGGVLMLLHFDLIKSYLFHIHQITSADITLNDDHSRNK